MKLFRLPKGQLLKTPEDSWHKLEEPCWDSLINRDDLHQHLITLADKSPVVEDPEALLQGEILPPIGSQEVWAAGVTYYSSQMARREEAEAAGGGDFYKRVYNAARPEIFFKATPARVVGPGQNIRIRRDSEWDVPEPELTLFINSHEKIEGYSIGNDMSSRSIEGENPLYLPQAKTHDKCAGLGPCLYVPATPISLETSIFLRISRGGELVFNGETQINKMKRSLDELVGYLCRETSFEQGVFLMTGTGIVPTNEFTLKPGDVIEIEIPPIGVLKNIVEKAS